MHGWGSKKGRRLKLALLISSSQEELRFLTVTLQWSQLDWRVRCARRSHLNSAFAKPRPLLLFPKEFQINETITHSYYSIIVWSIIPVDWTPRRSHYSIWDYGYLCNSQGLFVIFVYQDNNLTLLHYNHPSCSLKPPRLPEPLNTKWICPPLRERWLPVSRSAAQPRCWRCQIRQQIWWEWVCVLCVRELGPQRTLTQKQTQGEEVKVKKQCLYLGQGGWVHG